MIEPNSPLQPVWKPGIHANSAGETGVVLTETRPRSIAEITCLPGSEEQVKAAISEAVGIALSDKPGSGIVNDQLTAFTFAPSRFLVVDSKAGTDAKLVKAISMTHGAVVPLAHGLTAIRLSGPKAEWVMAKFFKIDFSKEAFPVATACATIHYDIATRIQRTGENQFDLYVFRSFARNFQGLLCNAAAEVGYEIK